MEMVSRNTRHRTEKEWDSLFQSIYERYFKSLCIFAASYLHDEDEAMEIVQNVMLKLWEQKDTYDTIINVNSYLYRSVKNQCFNALAHQKVIEKYKSEAWEELKTLEMKHTDENLQEEKEQRLLKAIETLPDRSQEVLKLSKLEGMKNKEIAEYLGISVKAVEANITRAYSILRKMLK